MRLAVVVWCLSATVATANTNNKVLRDCVTTTKDYIEAATCFNEWLSEQQELELQQLRQHLKENPQYRFGFVERERQWRGD